MKRNATILLAVAMLLAACHNPAGTKQFDPRMVDFTATYNTLFDNQLYPALILGLNQTQEDVLTVIWHFPFLSSFGTVS